MLCSRRTFQQLKLFSGRYVICLVRKHVNQGPSGPLICPVHQLLNLLLFGCPGLPVDRQLFAARVLVFWPGPRKRSWSCHRALRSPKAMQAPQGLRHKGSRLTFGQLSCAAYPTQMRPEPNLSCASTRRIPLRCFSVRGHRSEIMFSVLVIILRPDHVAGLGLSLG